MRNEKQKNYKRELEMKEDQQISKSTIPPACATVNAQTTLMKMLSWSSRYADDI